MREQRTSWTVDATQHIWHVEDEGMGYDSYLLGVENEAGARQHREPAKELAMQVGSVLPMKKGKRAGEGEQTQMSKKEGAT